MKCDIITDMKCDIITDMKCDIITDRVYLVVTIDRLVSHNPETVHGLDIQ